MVKRDGGFRTAVTTKREPTTKRKRERERKEKKRKEKRGRRCRTAMPSFDDKKSRRQRVRVRVREREREREKKRKKRKQGRGGWLFAAQLRHLVIEAGLLVAAALAAILDLLGLEEVGQQRLDRRLGRCALGPVGLVVG